MFENIEGKYGSLDANVYHSEKPDLQNHITHQNGNNMDISENPSISAEEMENADEPLSASETNLKYHLSVHENNVTEGKSYTSTDLEAQSTLESIDADLSLLTNFLGNEFGTATRIWALALLF